MYFDGASHREGAGAGVIFVTSQDEILPYSFTLTQCCSNNVSEYQFLILGLEMTVDMKQLHLQVFGDSELAINQLLGSYEVKKPELCLYHDFAQKLIRWLGEVTHQHFLRKENNKVDALAALASILALPDQTQLIICQKWIVPPDANEESKLEQFIDVSQVNIVDWRHALTDYLCYNILPEDPKRKTEILRRAPRFLYYKYTLYRRSFKGVLIRFFGRRRSKSNYTRSTFWSLWIASIWAKVAFSYKKNGVLLANNIKRLLGLCSKMSSMPYSCKIYAPTS